MKKEKRLNFKQNVRDFQTIEEKKPNEFLYDLLYVLFKRKYLAISLFIFTFVGIVFGTYLVTPLEANCQGTCPTKSKTTT